MGAGRRWVRRCSTARSIGSSPSIRSPRTTISRRYTRQRSRQSRAATALSSIHSARTTDLSFPSTEFSISRTFLKSSGIRCTTWWSSMRCSRTSCRRARSPMGNCSVSIPPTSRAGRSPCTRTQPRWICPTSRCRRCGGGLRLCARHGPRRGLRTGGGTAGQPGVGCAGALVFGRNEPGLQHRHQTWQEAISRRP